MKPRISTPLTIGIVLGLILMSWVAAAWLSHPGYARDENTGEVIMEGDKPRTNGPVFLPGPIAVLYDLGDLLWNDNFLLDIAQSLKRIALGVLAAAVPAFILGVWFGVAPRVRSVANPLFAFVQYIPPTAFAPILILWLGTGLQQQVALLFVGTFFYLTIMVAETVASTPQAYFDAALTLGVRPWMLVWKVILPHALPDFISHLRIIMGIAWTYLVVVELIGGDGIGRVIASSQRFLQTGKVLAGMLTIGILAIMIDLCLRQLSRWLCRWKSE